MEKSKRENYSQIERKWRKKIKENKGSLAAKTKEKSCDLFFLCDT